MNRIAIIGTGVSGSLAARLLSTEHDVTVFEAQHYVGGHANTVDVELDDTTFAVDTGFMVFNRRTYPHFCRLLDLLGVASQPSDMSFSVQCGRTGLEYQGSSLNGLFAQRLNCIRPSFLRMLADVIRFNARGMAASRDGSLRDDQTVGEFLRDCRVGSKFVHQYLIPMSAAIWSSRPEDILEFPARFMIGFFANHGLMQLRDRPQWRTILGGSRTYLQALLKPLESRIQLNAPIRAVQRAGGTVVVTRHDGSEETFDDVVLATHADQALKLLQDPSPTERDVLAAFPYRKNRAVLHTDHTMLPKRRGAWASWNYHIPAGHTQAASVTYDLSRLQNHASSTPILLTLNPTREIREEQILREFTYAHPGYASGSMPAQRRFDEISGRRHIHFCGAYWGYGFHEDGVNSALAVAKHFGIGLDACTVASTKESSRIAVSSL